MKGKPADEFAAENMPEWMLDPVLDPPQRGAFDPGPCTCADGHCARRGHLPQAAHCGHPGIKGTTPTGLTYCHRDDCRERAALASAILALTGHKAPPLRVSFGTLPVQS